MDRHEAHDSDDDYQEEVASKKEQEPDVDMGQITPLNVDNGTFIQFCYVSEIEPDPLEKTSKPGRFTCGTCSKDFTSKSGLKFHEKHFHTEGKLFCLICKKPFKLSNDLERHMNTHTGNRPWKCSHCDKAFVCKSSLSQHERLKHLVGDIFKCGTCDKTFNTKSDLDRHGRVHSGLKPFTCDKCSKSFTCKSSLNVHKRTHAGKTFKCNFCKMRFYIQTDLDRHETIHTGKKPYQCEFCKNSYSCKSSYKVHLRNVHSHLSPVHSLTMDYEETKPRPNVRVTFKLKSVETVRKSGSVVDGEMEAVSMCDRMFEESGEIKTENVNESDAMTTCTGDINSLSHGEELLPTVVS